MVKFTTIAEDSKGQRIDNYLFTFLKGVPKSRIYRGLRKGEFRVNGSRVSASYRLNAGDVIRIPPIQVGEARTLDAPPAFWIKTLESNILYEDERLLAINKPSGLPVHGGTNVSWGLIEIIRRMRTQTKMLELIHRLDRETSGCLLIAKCRASLLQWHHLLTHRQVKKTYTLLVKGHWDPSKKVITLPLKKNVLQSGERIVKVDIEGKPSETHFHVIRQFKRATLLNATLITGRTHQVRVHAASSGHPIAGDDKYGDEVFNRVMREQGLSRLFLHCASMSPYHAIEGDFQGVDAPLDPVLVKLLDHLA